MITILGYVGSVIGVILFVMVAAAIIYDIRVRLDERKNRMSLDESEIYLQEGPLDPLVEVLAWAAHTTRCTSCKSYNTSVFNRGYSWDGSVAIAHLSSDCSECRFRSNFRVGMLQMAMIDAQQCYERCKLQQASMELADFDQILFTDDAST